MRLDEEFAKEAFGRLLRSAGVQEVAWTDGRDPPDYELFASGTAFSVEVTQIFGSVRVGDQTKPERFWSESIQRFVKELQQEAKGPAQLDGCHHLHVEPVADLAQVRNPIRESIFSYARSTSAVSEAGEVEVWRINTGSRWLIRKICDGPFALLLSSSMGDAKWKDDVQRELDDLVAKTIESKRYKTRALRNVVLIFVDAYHYAEPDQWARAVNRSSSGHFHTIARAYGDFRCQILSKASSPW